MKRNQQVLVLAVAVVGVARATVEKMIEKKSKHPVSNELVVGKKGGTLTRAVEIFDWGIPEINLVRQELRNRFFHNRFGPPPRVLGQSGRPQRPTGQKLSILRSRGG